MANNKNKSKFLIKNTGKLIEVANGVIIENLYLALLMATWMYEFIVNSF